MGSKSLPRLLLKRGVEMEAAKPHDVASTEEMTSVTIAFRDQSWTGVPLDEARALAQKILDDATAAELRAGPIAGVTLESGMLTRGEVKLILSRYSGSERALSQNVGRLWNQIIRVGYTTERIKLFCVADRSMPHPVTACGCKVSNRSATLGVYVDSLLQHQDLVLPGEVVTLRRQSLDHVLHYIRLHRERKL